ncbi:polyketide cyclase/dehydrase/lipid transport protein [Tahibacter aquaticus]|uniref:Polyketide cyclase/dehydrase/lipid transport protein n=1 Tax=Tahibacter aquaticus TaxID=520092 RepID=A0A4R6YQ24_9GAMM|nr:SRPBCC family protein [Tahibacter aquaticus]TDR39991.1 polyketide cyclase/dehydrase/lipid transport protein [Tahibacter aquaticus]
MFKIIVLVVIAAIAAALVAAAFRPDSFRVERSIRIKASAEKIYAYLDDFHRWTAWSPWEKLDPALAREYSGSTSGKGAIYAWQGNNKVGQGRMEIIESVPHSRLAIKLDFLKPFEAHNTAEFTLKPVGDEIALNWAMSGPQPYLFRLMGLFVSMDKMVGKDFEAGLAALKASAES